MTSHRVAIMQPYFLPYIGYWQLLAAVDEFLVYDTVQLSSGSWVNRNRIRLDDRVQWLTVPLERAPHRTQIRHRRVVSDERWRDAMVRRVEAAHRGAPFRVQAIDLLRQVLDTPERDLTAFLVRSITLVASRLGIDTSVRRTSELAPPAGATAEDRVISLCRQVGASDHFNLSGGDALYDERRFRVEGVSLRIRVPPTPAPEGTPDRDDQTLSILDLLMQHEVGEVASWAATSRWTDPGIADSGRGLRCATTMTGNDRG